MSCTWISIWRCQQSYLCVIYTVYVCSDFCDIMNIFDCMFLLTSATCLLLLHSSVPLGGDQVFLFQLISGNQKAYMYSMWPIFWIYIYKEEPFRHHYVKWKYIIWGEGKKGVSTHCKDAFPVLIILQSGAIWQHTIPLIKFEKSMSERTCKDFPRLGCNKGGENKRKYQPLTAAGDACQSAQSILILQIHAFAVKSIICWHIYYRSGILAEQKIV